MGSRGIGNALRALSRDGVAATRVIGSGSALQSPIIARNTAIAREQHGVGAGIRLDDPTALGVNGGNTAWRNRISGSVNHDCHDTTSGTGTAGSANTWASDTAAPQDVANLCFSGAASGVAD